MLGTNMYSIAAVVILVLTLAASQSSAQQTAPLRCYICVTDYADSTQDPGCSVSSSKVIVRACAVHHGYDRCISYRARNTKTGNAVFRRHCATREMCEYHCLFSHHTNCQKSCCRGDLCNDVNFDGYEGSSEKPKIPSTTKAPITTQSPKTTSPTTKSEPTENSESTPNPTVTKKTTNSPGTTRKVSTTEKPLIGSESTPNPTVTKKTTNSPVTTHKVSTTEEPLIGGPTRPGCRDYRDECQKYAKYHAYCQYTREFMLINCPWSCDFCVNGGTRPTRPGTPTTKFATTTSVPDTTQAVKTTSGLIGGPTTGCEDARDECQFHADYNGYCSYHKGFMLAFCPKSCNFCDDVQLPESPVKKVTSENPPATTSKPEVKTSEQRQKTPTSFESGSGGEGYVESTLPWPLRKKPTPFGPGGEGYAESTLPWPLRKKPTPFGPGGEGYVESTLPWPLRKKPTPFGPGGEDYENSRCIDLRENCSYYAATYDDYCNYNNFFMAIYCPFSCGFCGATSQDGAFPHPPVVHQHPFTYQEFPPPPSEKDARWLTSFCGECQHGYHECIPKCILLLKDGIYEPTSNDVCMKLLGEPDKIVPC